MTSNDEYKMIWLEVAIGNSKRKVSHEVVTRNPFKRETWRTYMTARDAFLNTHKSVNAFINKKVAEGFTVTANYIVKSV